MQMKKYTLYMDFRTKDVFHAPALFAISLQQSYINLCLDIFNHIS